MHVPRYFEVTDRETIENFVKENGFATIVSSTNDFPIATHIPIEVEINEKGEKVLWGHIAKANPQWKFFESNPNVLVIFLSPVNHYISSSWYNHPNAPTWNYMSIHISGTIEIIQGEKLWESIRRLTNKYEQMMAKNPISLDTLPESVQKQMNGLVGFEISIQKVEASFKLSQNRDDEDYKNIIKELDELGTSASKIMAEELRKRDKA